MQENLWRRRRRGMMLHRRVESHPAFAFLVVRVETRQQLTHLVKRLREKTRTLSVALSGMLRCLTAFSCACRQEQNDLGTIFSSTSGRRIHARELVQHIAMSQYWSRTASSTATYV